MTKIRRNQPCPCGSGKKFKHCHGSVAAQTEQRSAPVASETLPPEVWALIDQKRKEAKAAEVQRQKQQGLGRPIVSHVFKGHRFVAVGTTLYSEKSERWKTFHVFLSDYFHRLLGVDWVNSEKAKPEHERHTIVRWLVQSEADLARTGVTQGGVRSAPMTGAIRAYLNLAYNLYLIGHHAGRDADRIVESYVARLKSARTDNFTGVLFETYAAAALLKAGFELDFENERDRSVTHVEFVATYPPTGKRFSVEVKARDWQPDANKRLRVARKLNQALGKHADHTRVVFIEVNLPEIIREETLDKGWPPTALREIRLMERLNREQSAYVIVTNHAFHSNLDAVGPAGQVLATGFNLPDFGPDVEFPGYKAILQSRERHVEMCSLLSSMNTHYDIPSTFDGDMADLAFVSDPRERLKFGQRYLVGNKDGVEVPGRFYEATVVEGEKMAYGAFELPTGEHIISTIPLTDAELAAYKKHPETFFGEVREPPRRPTTFVDLCDFVHGSYKNTPRERLLEFLAGTPDYEQLKGLSQKDLAITYAERCAASMFLMKEKKTS